VDKNRKTAFLVLRDVETKESYSNLALNHYMEAEKPDSPAFVRELTYGVLERKLWLDYMARQLLANPKARLSPAVRVLLRMGIYQIAFMDSVPDYAAVDGCVRLAKAFCRGREGFINGVLRSYLKKKDVLSLPEEGEDPAEYLSVRYSCAPWIVRLWLSQYGREVCEKLLAAGNERSELSLRANRLKITPEVLTRRLLEEGAAVGPGKAVPEALRVSGGQLLESSLYQEGAFSVQDESSMMAVEALDPQPGEIVVDVCAAPGGKSLFAAERMRDSGKVYSRDVYEKKLRLIEAEARRLGIHIIETKQFDGETTDRELLGKAHRVLVDAPCSGLGVIRRKPEIKYKEEAEEETLPEKQLRILQTASQYVRPGGVLVYSTCTVNRRENEEVVAGFLSGTEDFAVKSQRQIFPFEDGLDGFFICKMEKKGRE